MDYRLEDIIDVPLLQNLQDKLNRIYSFPSAIIDIDGKILTAVAWQDICTKFHRPDPRCEKECIKSDQYILEHLHEANPAVTYQCPHGLIDNAAPIVIDGKHLGNFFTGQFFLEKPDLEFFKKQAKKYGFDEKAYLEAVTRVPVWTREKLVQYLDFIKGFIEIIAGIGLKNLKEIEAGKVIRQSEERYRSLFFMAGEGIFIMTLDGALVEVNEAFAGMHGYRVDEMLKMSLKDLDTPETARAVPERLRRILEGETLTFEVEHYHKDGHVIILEVSASLIHQGGQSMIQSFHRNITERKRDEGILADERRRLSVILKGTNSGTWEWNVKTGETIFNERWAEIIGYTLDEISPVSIGTWTKFTHPDDLKVSAELLASHFMRKTDYYECEVRMKHKNGDWIWVLDRGQVNEWDADGRPVLMSGTHQDITGRIHAEEELIKALEKAKESDRLKSSFLANMSHEIRTPMNGILGVAELLKEPDLTKEEQEKYIRIIERSGARMLNIINDIISISKIESGQVEVTISEGDINEQLEFIYAFFRPEAAQKGLGISITSRLPANASCVFTDIEKINIILTNLLKNALKFTSNGFVEFGCEKKDGYLGFYVKDTGMGVPEEQKEIIFERFRQGSESLTRNYEGAGLGLSISRALVEMLGGKIRLESEPGKGSAFSFTIPWLANPGLKINNHI